MAGAFLLVLLTDRAQATCPELSALAGVYDVATTGGVRGPDDPPRYSYYRVAVEVRGCRVSASIAPIWLLRPLPERFIRMPVRRGHVVDHQTIASSAAEGLFASLDAHEPGWFAEPPYAFVAARSRTYRVPRAGGTTLALRVSADVPTRWGAPIARELTLVGAGGFWRGPSPNGDERQWEGALAVRRVSAREVAYAGVARLEHCADIAFSDRARGPVAVTCDDLVLVTDRFERAFWHVPGHASDRPGFVAIGSISSSSEQFLEYCHRDGDEQRVTRLTVRGRRVRAAASSKTYPHCWQ